jgi:two-component system phosphate regulon response regulator PhoB
MSEKKKVLLVEDTPAISRLTCFRLEKAGFEVFTAMDGLAALEVVKNNLPDIILLDCGLPGIDGGEVIRRLKADERFKKIPVIIFTATIENVKYFRQLGADDAIAKPYEPEELIAKIKNNLSS